MRYPCDELPAELVSGDEIYRHVSTTLFGELVPTGEILDNGMIRHVFDGEEVEVLVVAVIRGARFTAYWSTSIDPATVVDGGWELQSESTARRLFPMLMEYEYVSS